MLALTRYPALIKRTPAGKLPDGLYKVVTRSVDGAFDRVSPAVPLGRAVWYATQEVRDIGGTAVLVDDTDNVVAAVDADGGVHLF